MSHDSPPTPPLLARPLPIRGEDLLLVLIVAFGSVRLLAGLIVAFAALGDRVGLPLALRLSQDRPGI